MKAFVVIANAMGGEQFVSVHRARPDVETGARVLEVNVVGTRGTLKSFSSRRPMIRRWTSITLKVCTAITTEHAKPLVHEAHRSK